MGAKPPTFESGDGGEAPSLEIPNSVTGLVMFFVVFSCISPPIYPTQNQNPLFPNRSRLDC